MSQRGFPISAIEHRICISANPIIATTLCVFQTGSKGPSTSSASVTTDWNSVSFCRCGRSGNRDWHALLLAEYIPDLSFRYVAPLKHLRTHLNALSWIVPLFHGREEPIWRPGYPLGLNLALPRFAMLVYQMLLRLKFTRWRDLFPPLCINVEARKRGSSRCEIHRKTSRYRQ